MKSARFAHVAENDTLPKLLRHNARRHGAEVALREKTLVQARFPPVVEGLHPATA